MNRYSPDGILRNVRRKGAITLPTLTRLLALLKEKTDYPHHIAVEITTGALLKTIDNEEDALETVRRLEEKPTPAAPALKTKECWNCGSTNNSDYTDATVKGNAQHLPVGAVCGACGRKDCR